MKTKFQDTTELENQARRFLKSWNNDQAYGLKCWYSYVGNIENGSDTLLIGLNPGGDATAVEHDEQNGYLEKPYTTEGFNSWLDEAWLGKGPHHQNAMHQVFKTIFGSKWEQELRAAACTNIFPIRTSSINAIDDAGWEFAHKWFKSILGKVEPKRIICNGNNNQNSAWSYLRQEFKVSSVQKIGIGSSAYVKTGTMHFSKQRISILALPTLSRFARGALYTAIKKVLNELHETDTTKNSCDLSTKTITSLAEPQNNNFQESSLVKSMEIKKESQHSINRRKVMNCNTSKEGYAMVLTCFLEELGISDVNSLKIRVMLEDTCLPYKNNGKFLSQWVKGQKIYLYACRGILDGDSKMIAKYGGWVAKGGATLADNGDVKQMFEALSKHFPEYTPERHEEILKKTRKRLLELRVD